MNENVHGILDIADGLIEEIPGSGDDWRSI